MRDKEIDKEIPVIAVTAVSNRTDREVVTKLSVSDYLLKPIRSDVLIRAVQEALSGSRELISDGEGAFRKISRTICRHLQRRISRC